MAMGSLARISLPQQKIPGVPARAVPALPQRYAQTLGHPQLPAEPLLGVRYPRIRAATALRRRAHAGRVYCRVTFTSSPTRVTPRQVLSTNRYADAGLTVEVARRGRDYEVVFTAERARPLVLHWGVEGWLLPPEAAWPPATVKFSANAVQSPFQDGRRLTIKFDESYRPARMVFVLKETSPERWIKLQDADFTVLVNVPRAADVVSQVVELETLDPQRGLYHRLRLAAELLDGAAVAGAEAMALILVWLRLSALKQLPWYNLAGHSVHDIMGAAAALADRLAEKARSGPDPMGRLMARMALACVPRGSSNGEEILGCIFGTMKDHNISKDGLDKDAVDEPFLRDWARKLKNSSTPEDIALCRAYLDFQETGNVADFYQTALERGGITPTYLAALQPPIKGLPKQVPAVVPAMQHLLWLLRTAFSGPDLEVSLEMAAHCLDDQLRFDLYDALKNRREWWVPGKIVDMRERMRAVWKAPTSRDVLMLDIALDRWFRKCIEDLLAEPPDNTPLDRDQQVELLHLALRNAAVAGDEDMRQCLAYWDKVKSTKNWISGKWAHIALAAAERLQSTLGHQADAVWRLVTPHVERFCRECGVPESFTTERFAEDLVRGQSSAAIGGILKGLIPLLRVAAGASSWWVVSDAGGEAVTGYLQLQHSLGSLQGQVFDTPQVVVVKHLSSHHEIPEGVVAVLTRRGTELLSHAAIRARARGILLACCIDPKEMDGIVALKGYTVRLTVSATGAIVPRKVLPLDPSQVSTSARLLGPLSIPTPAFTPAWVLREEGFRVGLVGAKAMRLTELRRSLPAPLSVPTSISLPFRTFERAVAHISNARTAAVVAELLRKLELVVLKEQREPPRELLQALRQTVTTDLQAPEELRRDLAAAAAAAGLISSADVWSAGSPQWAATWAAITRVWASKWNPHAWVNRRERSIQERQLNIACTLQKVLPAQYSFILHTAHPVTKQRGELFGEVVVGLGEALVGNHHGRALSFTTNLHEGHDPKVLCLPSKRSGFFVKQKDTLIVRSDSNGEDLAEYSGAGLYDSVVAAPLHEAPLDYSQEALLWDEGFRSKLLRELTRVGRVVQTAYGGTPQDIEGVWQDGKVVVVQSRPQQLL